jgi:hypothetical protein
MLPEIPNADNLRGGHDAVMSRDTLHRLLVQCSPIMIERIRHALAVQDAT